VVDQRVGLHGEHVAPAGHRDRLGGHPLGLPLAAPPGEDRRQRSAPLDLRVQVVAEGQLPAEPGEAQGLVVAALGAHGPGEVGGQLRAQAALPHPL
jgi:hypothetical protein